jgi:hypothetical protein
LDSDNLTAGGAQTGVGDGGGSGNIANAGGITINMYGSAISTLGIADAWTGTGAATGVIGILNGNYLANGRDGQIGNITVLGTGTPEGSTVVAAYATTGEHAIADPAQAQAYGILGATFGAAIDGASIGAGVVNGTIGAINETIKVIATNTGGATTPALTGLAKADAYGISGAKFDAGDQVLVGGKGSIGAAGNLITVTALATDLLTTNVAVTQALAYGITTTPFTAGLTSGTIGNITANATATVNAPLQTTSISQAYGIDNALTVINAGAGAAAGTGIIGSIIGTAVANDNNIVAAGTDTAIGLNGITVQAGVLDGNGAGAGTIANITGTATATVNPAATTNIGINGITALAGTSITNGISATTTGAATGFAIAINGGRFQADGGVGPNADAGTLGNIFANSSGTVAINAVLFSSIQTIGTINATGDVQNSQFVAGDSYAVINTPAGGRYNNTSLASIGNVSITGKLISSDIIAGENATNNIFGDVGAGLTDTPLGGGVSTIGSVRIGTLSALPEGANVSPSGHALGRAIEAQGGLFSVVGATNGVQVTPAGVLFQAIVIGTDIDSDLTNNPV